MYNNIQIHYCLCIFQELKKRVIGVTTTSFFLNTMFGRSFKIKLNLNLNLNKKEQANVTPLQISTI